MTDQEKRVRDLELAVAHLARERLDHAYPVGNDDREEAMRRWERDVASMRRRLARKRKRTT